MINNYRIYAFAYIRFFGLKSNENIVRWFESQVKLNKWKLKKTHCDNNNNHNYSKK